MTVAVLPNLDKPGCSEVVEKLSVILKNEGIKAYIPDTILAAGYEHAPEEELYSLADVIITIGGDGTINEIVNGAPCNPNVEFGVIPSGTGNDFVRNFTNVRNR